MENNNRSILRQLDRQISRKQRTATLENRASHVIASVQNLLESLEDIYEPHEVEDLHKKLINSIKNKDDVKFLRALRKLEANRKGNNNE